MALIHYDFYSHALKKDTSVNVILPEYKVIRHNDEKLKTLYLFHGFNDNYTKWARRTLVERYAIDDNWAIVMPEGEKSFYTNTVTGANYWDYISEELPTVIRRNFPLLSDKREDNYTAGLSMGGYGSIKLTLNCPDRYCAAASFSGAMDIWETMANNPTGNSHVQNYVYGTADAVLETENDLFYLIRKMKEEGKEIPRLYITCGTEDFIYPQNVKFHKYLESMGVPHTYQEWPGEHDWVFWDESIKRALSWFLNP